VKRSKAYRNAAEKIEAGRLYAPLEAVRLAKGTTSTKYDATVEVALRLGVDPRKADQMVRGTVNLPHGTARPHESWSSPPVSGQSRQRLPGPTTSAQTSCSTRWPVAGSSSTLSSRRLT
jgi:hypothetical protein